MNVPNQAQQLPLQQTQQDMLYGFAPPQNRSPGSQRDHLYGSAAAAGPAGFPSGLTMNRQAQRLQPFDPVSPLVPGHAYGMGIGAGGVDDQAAYGAAATSRFDRMQPPPGVPAGLNPAAYMMQNDQVWDQNAINTVNGAMNGTNRLRNVSRRAPLPNAWVDPSAGQFPSVNSMGGLPFNLVDNYQNVSPMTSNPVGSRPPPPPQQPKQEKGDDIIKTAIVIKNIPFALKKEILQAIMMEMQLPMPYAFNYHFEGDAFRGLAFANFLNEEDTAHVIAKLNQQEIMGRKLRVEYKKQLPDHERERIEREKKEKRGQLRMQHEPMSLHQQSSLQSLTSALTSNMQPRSSPLRDVDFNDPETLEFYTQLTLFKNDPSREILIFPSSITPEQRRHIHILAHNMGLQHQSIGEADQRQLQITKKDSPAHAQPSGLSALTPSITYDAHRRGLSRAATIDFAESRTGGAGGHFGSVRQGGATLEVPGSPDGGIPSNLRAAKSFADLRSYTPSPSSVSSYVNQGPGAPPTSASNGLGAAMRYGEYTKLNQSGSLVTPPNLTPTTPGNTGVGSSTPGGGPESLLSSLGSMSLGYDHSSTIGHPQPARSNPGAIGSQRPSAAAAQAQANADKVAAERQPRGPGVGWETAGGFGSRTRSSGHMQRGSDSSENANRPGGNTGSRFLS